MRSASRITLALLLLGLVGIGVSCRASTPRSAHAGQVEATLAYRVSLAGDSPFGVRVWEDGPQVRASAFGGARLTVRDTSVIRASLQALTALAATPPDTVPQDSVLADGTRMGWLCGDGVSAGVTVRGPSGVYSASDRRCRKSAAEVRFRQAADSIYALLTAPVRH